MLEDSAQPRKSRLVWNSLWLGAKPVAQFLIGALLFASDRAAAGSFYNLLLLWSFGFSVCAVLIDRQIVVLAQSADLKPASVVKALLPWLLGVGLTISIVAGPFAGALAGVAALQAVAVVASGALSGIAEACCWSVLADRGAYRTLAALRFATLAVFVALLVWAFGRGGASMAWVFAGEALAMSVFGGISLRTDFAATRARVSLQSAVCSLQSISIARVLGFWALTGLVYFHQQFDFWWTTSALTKPDLAAYRLGAAPRSFLLLGMSALLQPILFRISSRDWRKEQPSAQASATKATDLLFVANSCFVALTVMLALAHPPFLAHYGAALKVAWVLTGTYAAFGWFGTLGSTVMTNAGAIRLPMMVVACSIAIRAALYGGLAAYSALTLPALIAASETLLLAAQVLFWRYVASRGIWKLGAEERRRLLVRAPLALGALACAAAVGFSTAGLVVLVGTHCLLAGSAWLCLRSQMTLKADVQQVQDAA